MALQASNDLQLLAAQHIKAATTSAAAANAEGGTRVVMISQQQLPLFSKVTQIQVGMHVMVYRETFMGVLPCKGGVNALVVFVENNTLH
jgi:hypothetical protein